MDTIKLKNELQEIQNRVDLPEHIIEIINKVSEGTVTMFDVEKSCLNSKINTSIAKVNFLHFIFEYIREALDDDILSLEEKETICYFKRIFQIIPGDFMFHTKEQVDNTIRYQLARIYNDNYITSDEALLKIDLQEIFDLSYDQMNEYAKLEAATSLKQGAEIGDLDVFFTHIEYFDLKGNL